MVYIDKAFYDGLFPGNDLTDAEFTSFQAIAADIIDAVTMYRASTPALFDALPAETQTRIKRAVAYQLNTIDAQGGMSVVQGYGGDSSKNSESIGKYAYSGSSASNVSQSVWNGIPLSPLLNSILFPTGLLNRAAEVVCR